MIYRIFLLLITCIGVYSVKKAEEIHYDMQCDCGQRKMDEKSEKDCEESAKLESANKEVRIRDYVQNITFTLSRPKIFYI